MNSADDSLEIRMKNSACKHDPSDRVAVIIDVRNIVCRQATDYANTVIDYGKLLREVLDGRRCIAAVAVDAVRYDTKGRDVSRTFHEELRKAGFRLELVEASNKMGKQDGADVMVAVQAVKYALQDKCDAIELITGDGDFTVLVRELQGLCVNVGVSALFGNLSYALSDQADSVRILDRTPLVRMCASEAEVY